MTVNNRHLFVFVSRNAVWPGGVRPSQKEGGERGERRERGEGEGERERLLRCVLARSKLIGSVPDDLRRLLGTRRTTQGMARCVCVCVRACVCVCGLHSSVPSPPPWIF